MDIKELLKKYWFICVVALGLVAFLVVYAVQTVQNRPVYVNEKTENGKSVVYTLNGENYYADDLYEDLYEDHILRSAYFKWSMEVINAAVETDDELSQYATNYAAYLQNNNDDTTIDNYLKQYGYPGGVEDLYAYCLDMIKADQLYYGFFKENFDTYVPNIIRDLKPKNVSHILIKVENVEETSDKDGNTIHAANPSEEEKAKLDEVLKALESEDFAEVAKKYSDDGSATDGGFLGIYDNQTAPSQFVKEFADGVVALDYDTVSEPIVSQYGYHIIKVEKPTKDELIADQAFMSEVNSYYQYVDVIAVKEKSDELGFNIVDEDLKARIQEYVDAGHNELAYYNSLGSEVSE